MIITRLGTDFAPEIRKLTDGRGVDVVFDPVSGEFTKDYMNGLNWGARVIIYGMLNGLDINIRMLPSLRSTAWVHRYSCLLYTSRCV